jgi:hypothetical protein
VQFPGGLHQLQGEQGVQGDHQRAASGHGKEEWTASYLFCVSPWVLIDNYKQARKCMEVQESG